MGRFTRINGEVFNVGTNLEPLLRIETTTFMKPESMLLKLPI